ncbi:family 78 glycoside hydrolase catalytic domain [Chitinophaga horti]|uniref:Family 78 glycoside hydrolase catalytic domain n=1 Tax=Chitinophaga horti TaxID=2920382 RepID=A0ABY6J3I4_9BACT|nr:family 78 glycoside hydrolase catalytic domain [Chitinophaga horti]UYQ94197.1 family 78 glycoside hydrolase catalytic domain [Chitinophaga horti]
MNKRLILLICVLAVCLHVSAQNTAKWIAPADTAMKNYGVYHFRKTFNLTARPTAFPILISADNRYQLFVNGVSVNYGPQRSDPQNWRYDSLNIASHLKKGENILAVTVWNQGVYAAWAQLSVQTGLWLKGDGVNSDTSWQVMNDHAYTAIADDNHIVGPFEQLTAAQYPWGWQQAGYNARQWQSAKVTGDKRTLFPRNIPLPEVKPQRFAKVRRADGLTVTDAFLSGKKPLQIAAGKTATILLDQGVLTTAFPELVFSGGRDSKITITYAESLYDDKTNQKGNRNEVTGKHIAGQYDVFIADGGSKRLFSPLYYRTFRYVELKIETLGEPLTIQDVRSNFTAYPFVQKASFRSSDPSLTQIWDIGWRTSRLCAYETYMDCPYYEQLQYIGDTRIQALISMYVSGDDRLMKNAIRQFRDSRIADGLTQSRYPSNMRQIIPPFSLFWIAMINDYAQLGKDTSFTLSMIPSIERILGWHENHVRKDQLLGKMPYWNFVDWPAEWPWKGEEETSGIPAGTLEGGSAILTLQYVYALQQAAAIYRQTDNERIGASLDKRADVMKKAVYELCWDASRGMLADSPEKKEFSQHVNALGVLTDVIPEKDQRDLLLKVEKDSTLIQCTIYYRFYLSQAFKKAGLGDEYVRMLKPWKGMIDLGLTTFAERPEPTRSDCHAWSASPNYDLLATVCGITPASAGFKSVSVAPHLGSLEWVECTMPHWAGTIEVKLKRTAGKGVQGTVTLPAGISGTFKWNGQTVSLAGKKNEINL